MLLAEALEDDGVLVFEHDPVMAACRLREERTASRCSARRWRSDPTEHRTHPASVRPRAVDGRRTMLEAKVNDHPPRRASGSQGGHLWIYRGDVEKAPAGAPGGRRRRASWTAAAASSPRRSGRRAPDRAPHRDARRGAGGRGVLRRRGIAGAIALREPAFGDERFVRLVHGEADLLPGLVVDRYGDVAVLQTLVPATDRRKALLAELVASGSRVRTVVERNDVRVRELEGLAQVKGVLRGADARRRRVPRGRGADARRRPRRAEDRRLPRPAREPPARRRVRPRPLPRLLQLRRRLRAAARAAGRAGDRGRDAARPRRRSCATTSR